MEPHALSIFVGASVALAVGYIFLTLNVRSPFTTDDLYDEYDYIVIGAGTAGSVVAARLSEDQNENVLLLEAGEDFDESEKFHTPLYAMSLQHTGYDWEYYTEPQEVSQLGMKDNRGYIPRGKVLGGSNMLNYLQYTRGSKYDFDEWASNGCSGWSYKDVLPYFLKTEDIQIDELKTSKYHHSGGALAVSSGVATPLADLYLKAGKEAGYNVTDYNGEDQEGFSYIQLSTRHGARSSSAIELLLKTGDRKNLDIAVNSFVTKIEIENKKATGVYVIRDLTKYFIKARKEIIVSAGAINSPQLLMLSGVGPKDHLESIGIPVQSDLPVGLNLQDHQMAIMFSKINVSYGITEEVRESYWTKLKYKLFGTGPLAVTGEGTGFFYIDQSKKGNSYPHIQFIFWSLLPSSNYYNFKDEVVREILAKSKGENGFVTLISVMHPKSSGFIKLRSNDPFDYPFIDPQYLTKQHDIDAFISGIRIWEGVIETPTMKSLGAKVEQANLSFCSHHKFRSDAYWECYIRYLAANRYHQSGTCKMGAESDMTAVVDPSLRVKGIKGLRVVDASVLPNITSGNINSPIIMMAEKITDNIRGIDSVKEIRKKLKTIM